MKTDEVFGWIFIIGSSIGLLKMSFHKIPESVGSLLEWALTAVLMAQLIWGIFLVKKSNK